MMQGRFAAQAIIPFAPQASADLVGRRPTLEEPSGGDQVRALPQLGSGIVGEPGQPGSGQEFNSGLPSVNVRFSGIRKSKDRKVWCRSPCNKVRDMIVEGISTKPEPMLQEPSLIACFIRGDFLGIEVR